MELVNNDGLLSKQFYLQDTRDVARSLLGKRLCRETGTGIISATIVETEAYLYDDPASHSFRGKSNRNAPMFGPPANTYVYLSYGVHDMLNIVTAPEGVGEAVLIRAAFPADGIEIMRRHCHKPDTPMHRLAAGPGLVAKAFGISRKIDNGIDVTTKAGGIWIENGDDIPAELVVVTTRIGLTQAAEELWRFYIKGNEAVSRK